MSATEGISDRVRASATDCAPPIAAAAPPVMTRAKAILKSSSANSVAEKCTNFLRPQNQLLSGA